MHKAKLLISIFIFAILFGFTSIVKTQTRIIEKKIEKKNDIIAVLKKDLHETQLDYFYLSSPGNISKKIINLDINEYSPMDFSRIYMSYKEFIESHNKVTTIKINGEKKTKKK